MYARKAGERELNFQVSGKLWRRSLVMRDVETGSLWSHLLGRCMDGELQGTELTIIPSTITTWEEWRQRHPQTTLLAMSRTADRFDDSVWRNPRKFVYGVRPEGTSTPAAVGLPRLVRDRIVLVEPEAGAMAPVVVTYSPDGQRCQAFSTRLGDRQLAFELSGETAMTDSDTGSTWNPTTGECTTGELEGEKLTPVPGFISYRNAWREFYPDGPIID